MSRDATIDIAIAADEAFAMPMAVTVKSMLLSAAGSSRFRAFVMDGGITEGTRRRVESSWRDDRLEYRWVKPDLGVLSGLPVSGHVNAMTYARLLLQHYVPEHVERVIYLDSDLLVLGDLSEVWSAPWQDVACLAVPDVGAPWIDAVRAESAQARCIRHLASQRPISNYEEFGLRPDDPYFNAGVLVANLREWRKLDLCAAALDCLSVNRQSVSYWDQYAINVVLRGRFRALPLEWNQGLMAIAYRHWKRSPFDAETFRRIRHAPKIVHFTTGSKPWNLDGIHPFRRHFFEVVDQTEWRGWRPGSPGARAVALCARAWRSLRRRSRLAVGRGQ